MMTNKIEEMIREGCLVTAGNLDNYNTMTIGWGMMGTIWHKSTFIVYIRPSRYTYKFMEDNDYFTVSFYKDKYKKEVTYLGTHSGKDTNKVEDVNFHPVKVDDSVSFKEAYLTIVCKKYYSYDLDYDKLPDDVKKRYYDGDTLHRVYYGEIVDIKEN